jgi:tetratricopeptide (TPR) repeat protein
MITFFRKTRLKLAYENKFSKYFRYAFGEIILVAIGILIALQVNNWNGNRKGLNAELQLYSNLLDDLNNEYSNNRNDVDWVNDVNDFQSYVYNEINGEAQYDPSQYYNYLIYFYRYNTFIIDKYQESLSQLTNDQIHGYLKRYIRQETNTIDAVDEWNEYQVQQVRPFLSRHGINNTEVMFNEQYDEFAPIVNNLSLINHSKLKEQYGSEEFDQLLFNIRFKTMWMAQNFRWLKDSIHRFQVILSKEMASTKLKGTYDMVYPETFDEFIVIGTSTGDIIDMLKEAVENKGTYDITETEVNEYGYDLMGDGKLEDARNVFRLNTELYPDSWNTYDSYGEYLLELGEIENGIKAYKKSLELNPNNYTAKEVLKRHKNEN